MTCIQAKVTSASSLIFISVFVRATEANKQNPGAKQEQSACRQTESGRKQMCLMEKMLSGVCERDVVVFALRVKGTSSLFLHKVRVYCNIYFNHTSIYLGYLAQSSVDL